MFQSQATQALLKAALVVAGVFAGMQTADAGPYRVRFDPGYSVLFPGLGWQGEALFDEGDCTKVGSVNNLPGWFPGGCGGELTLTNAFVEFYTNADPNNPNLARNVLYRLDFTGGQVITADIPALGVKPTAVVSTPFDPEQGAPGFPLTEYLPSGEQAWFSLVFAGEFAQLYWFQSYPGEALDSIWTALTYKKCFFGGAGPTEIGDNVCGLSDANGGKGAILVISDIPEPASYALVLAGLAGLAFFTRRRSLKS